MSEQEPDRTLNGNDILAEILRNCEAGLFTIRRVTLVPCIYRVYLHPGDFALVQPVMKSLVSEACAALDEQLLEWNRKARPSAMSRALGFTAPQAAEYKIVDAGWTVELLPDTEERLKKGEIEVYSELAAAPQPEYSGEKTRVLTRRGETRSEPEHLPASFAAPLDSADENGTSPTIPRTIYAYIRYKEQSGEMTFPVTKDRIVIGRGGKTYWVDLKLQGPPDISREHCRIRRDETTGTFFLKDVSQYGVTVDGKKVPASLQERSGQQIDANLETPLPLRCVIGLADAVYLEWETAGAR